MIAATVIIKNFFLSTGYESSKHSFYIIMEVLPLDLHMVTANVPTITLMTHTFEILTFCNDTQFSNDPAIPALFKWKTSSSVKVSHEMKW